MTEVERALLRSAMALISGLHCNSCDAQGRDMALRCSRDADCDSGWTGIHPESVREWLEGAEALLPGTLAQLENPSRTTSL
jgi:hypothetical protein